jgi:hypothetical protein
LAAAALFAEAGKKINVIIKRYALILKEYARGNPGFRFSLAAHAA